MHSVSEELGAVVPSTSNPRGLQGLDFLTGPAQLIAHL